MADLGLAAKVRPILVLSVDYREEERAVVSYVIRTASLRGTRYEFVMNLEVCHREPLMHA
jgi:hypothetical protein